MWLSVKAHWLFQCQPMKKVHSVRVLSPESERAGPKGENTALEAGILAQPLGASRVV